MKNKGFALLEVLIAIGISAFVSMIVYEGFYQLNRTVGSIDNTVDEHTKATLIAWHMTKDISGAFIPPRVIQERAKKEEKPKPQAPQANNQKPAIKEEPQEEKKEPVKPLTHIFYATSTSEKNLQLLTCISNNPLHVYWSESAGSAKPNIMRVMYQIKPQAPVLGWKNPSYVLVRKESPILDFDLFKDDAGKKIREYEVASGIKQLTCTFLSAPPIIKKKENSSGDKTKKEPEKKQGPIDYKTFEQWDKEQQNQNNQEKDRQPEPIVPHFVNITIVLWGNLQKSEKTFTAVVPIYPDLHYLPQKEVVPEKPAAPTQNGKVPQNPSGPAVPSSPKPSTPSTRVGSS